MSRTAYTPAAMAATEALRCALDNSFGAICSVYEHSEASEIILGLIAQHTPQAEEPEVHWCTHYIDGECGPAYVAHLQVDGQDFTAFLSIEFGCVDVVGGVRWPSYWN